MKRRIFSILLASCTLFLFCTFSASSETAVYRNGNRDSMKIALTFDDGPHPTLTPKILDILDRYGVKATFFEVGENVRNYPEAAREVLKRGHEVGNHTDTHPHLSNLGDDALIREITRCEDALEELCEYRPHLLRPPEGTVNACVRRISEIGDYRLVLWSIDTKDWRDKNAASAAENVLSNVKGGDIILMHDYIGTGSQTPEALELILPELLNRGYEFVTVSDLLG